MLFQNVGERVRRAREGRGLSQDELGAGRFTRAHISAIELGKVRPSLEALSFIARRLGLPISHFLSPRGDAAGEVALVLLAEAELRLLRGSPSDALALLGELDPGTLGLSERARSERLLGQALLAIGSLEEAEKHLLDALGLLAAGAGDGPAEGEAADARRPASETTEEAPSAATASPGLEPEVPSLEQPKVRPEEQAEICRVRHLLGRTAAARGDPAGATYHLNECLRLLKERTPRDAVLEVQTLRSLAEAYVAQHQEEVALTAYRQAAETYGTITEAERRQAFRGGLFTATSAGRRASSAEELLAAAREELTARRLLAMENEGTASDLLLGLGLVHARLGEWTEAERHIDQALSARRYSAGPPEEAYQALAELYLGASCEEEALRLADRAAADDRGSPERGKSLLIWLAAFIRARAAQRRGLAEEASTQFGQAVAALRGLLQAPGWSAEGRSRLRRQLADITFEFGLHRWRTGQPDQGVELLVRAYRLRQAQDKMRAALSEVDQAAGGPSTIADESAADGEGR